MRIIQLFIAKAHILCALVLFCNFSVAQINLVPNPSFELLAVKCDSIINGKGGVLNWNSQIKSPNKSINIYSISNKCSKDSCCTNPIALNALGYSYQLPHSGNSFVSQLWYVDINSNSQNERDYIQAKLIDSLKKNKLYYIEFFANCYDWYRTACSNVGLLVTDTAIWSVGKKAMLYTPQIEQYGNPILKDTQNWVRVAGIYKSHGGEKYIRIGNFGTNASTDTVSINKYAMRGSTYNIDDVSVIPLDSMQLNADAGRDTTINKGDSVWIGSRLCGLDSVQWYDSLHKPIAINVPGLWVKPVTNSYYVITQTVNGYYSTDTVHVGVRQPLPVVIVNGQLLVVSEHAVKFSWVCANEVNLLHYVVERSVDGRHYEGVGTVHASGVSEYSFLDNGVAGGVYYRLRIVDRDGAVSYSPVYSLPLTTNNLPLTISPNPAKDVVTISGKGIGEVQLIDSWGKVVLTTKAANGHTTMDIKRLSGGVYVVKAFRSEGVVTGKFLKQ